MGRRRTAGVVIATAVALLSTGVGCGSSSGVGPDEVRRPTIRLASLSPAPGSQLRVGDSFQWTIETVGAKNVPAFHYVVALLRDDEVYSPILSCGQDPGGEGTGTEGIGGRIPEGAFGLQLAVILRTFGIGHRIKSLVVFVSRQSMCSDAPPDPSKADMGRFDLTLDWLIGDALAGDTKVICHDDPIPRGWWPIQIGTAFIGAARSCRLPPGTRGYDSLIIKYLEGLPSGTALSICLNGRIPDGWESNGRVTQYSIQCDPQGSSIGFTNSVLEVPIKKK